MATVHTCDVLICCISQCVAALKEGREISRTIRFKAYELMMATNSCTVTAAIVDFIAIPHLDADVYELAREAAPGWDVRYIEQ